MNRPSWLSEIDDSWTLFLDRDGVINERLMGDYVKHIGEFKFTKGACEALETFNFHFGPIVVVTNQQGIGKNIMTETELLGIHQYMLAEVGNTGGRIDSVYYCPGLAQDDPPCRKPNTEMAFDARKDHPEIDFKKSVMVGDSPSDMEFGERLGMKRVFVGGEREGCYSVDSLFHFSEMISSK